MKKSVKNKNSKDIWRWVALAPVVCVTWWVVVILCSYLYSWFYTPNLLQYWGPLMLIFLPSVAIFFVARWIAPKYKNITAVSAVVLCILWGLFLFYGLSHMAY